MGDITRTFESAQTLYQTNLYGGVDADIAGTEVALGVVDLATGGYDGVHVHIKYRGSGSTDELDVLVQGSLDGSTASTEEIHSLRLPATASDKTADFTKRDLAGLSMAAIRNGSTDTFDLEVTYRRWKWTSA